MIKLTEQTESQYNLLQYNLEKLGFTKDAEDNYIKQNGLFTAVINMRDGLKLYTGFGGSKKLINIIFSIDEIPEAMEILCKFFTTVSDASKICQDYLNDIKNN